MNFDAMTFGELYRLCLAVTWELTTRIWWVYPLLFIGLAVFAIWYRKKS